jgi:hypothetical protein
MATVPVPHWHSGSLQWSVQYETCSSGLCPVQQAYLQIPNGTTTYLHWTWNGAPAEIQMWVVPNHGSPVFYSNSTAAPFEYVAVDSPYALLVVVPHPLNGPITLELNYSFEQSTLLL